MGLKDRNKLRNILFDLKHRELIYDFFEITEKHSWYKSDEIQFTVYPDEAHYDHDCCIHVYFKDDVYVFEQRDHVYSRGMINELSDIYELEEYLKSNYSN